MNRTELALAAHNAIHSGVAELVLPSTRWRIRMTPGTAQRCVAVFTKERRFYFEAQDAWDTIQARKDFAIITRLGHQVTWMKERFLDQQEVNVIIDGKLFSTPEDALRSLAEVTR